MKKKLSYLIMLVALTLLVGCSASNEDASTSDVSTDPKETTAVNTSENNTKEEVIDPVVDESEQVIDPVVDDSEQVVEETVKEETKPNSKYDKFAGYKLIEVDGGDQSGHRQSNVVVDIGFGDREYYAFTNEHGQLVRVIADEIILQDDNTEPVTSSGRYYHDEAKVPGVERDDLDEGHIIADSLGGVSNAYNISPQEKTLNRHGDQAYLEDSIRKAGGATDFEAIITYPDTKTQIPSSYFFEYTIRGNKVTDEFLNVNPDEINKSLGLTESKPSSSTINNGNQDISSIDTNGNGKVTIQEAKDAGFSMPISKNGENGWLYEYMIDNDGDGLVGE